MIHTVSIHIDGYGVDRWMTDQNIINNCAILIMQVAALTFMGHQNVLINYYYYARYWKLEGITLIVLI